MKINKVLKLIFVCLVIFFSIQFLPNNKVEATSKLNLNVSYSYDKNKDVVTVKVKSNIKFKKTKPTWTLSKDKKTYSKKFYTNQTYSTKFKAQNGKSKTVKIKVKQIKGPKLTVTYKYDKKKNKVKVNVTSTKKYKDTKTSWILSKGKYTYTKFYNKNKTESITFYDKYSNKKTVKIKVNQIDNKGPKVKVTYKYITDDKSINKSVLVTVTSDEEMKKSINEKWTLSKDKKVYTRTFKANTKFDITLKDKYGNKTKQTINITKIGKKAQQEENQQKKSIYSGIDVSSHNDKIDWEKIKKSGIDFVIIRCGYGKNTTSQDDLKFRYNIEECKRLSIPYGIYLYSYALNTNDAKSEAEHVQRLIEGYAPKYGIWFDMEDADGYKKRNGMPSNEQLVDICDTFCKAIKKKGYKNVGIYANLDWWNNKLNSTKLDVYDKWVAQWGSKCTYGKKYVMWQYTSDGSVDGIIGRVDMNYCYKMY